MKISRLALLLSILTRIGVAQVPDVELHRVKIVTQRGQRVNGYLYDVTDSYLLHTNPGQNQGGSPNGVLLFDIRKVVLYRRGGLPKTIRGKRRLAGALQGAVIGGLGLSFLTLRSLQRNPLRSPVSTGLSLTLATGAGVLFGGAVGVGINALRGRREEDPEATLRARLLPYSYRYQSDLLRETPFRPPSR